MLFREKHISKFHQISSVASFELYDPILEPG